MIPASVQLVQDVNRVARKGRYPVHNFLIEHLPFQIQPFLIHPVLPGETLKNVNFQGRVISDPLKSGVGNVLPWWVDHYFFYVKIRQLDGVREAFEEMVLNGTPLGITDPANTKTYHNGGSIDWVKRCLDFVVAYGGFRDDGETADPSIDGLPIAAAHRHGQSFLDSLTVDTEVDPVPNDLQNPHHPDIMAQYSETYERMRAMRLIDMSFEDWLETYGVKLSDDALVDRPELIRVESEWQYPANTVDPATGLATGVLSASINGRADKDRFFKEPGFIFGVTVVRPKIYLANQTGSAAAMFDDALSWMPRMLHDQPHITVREFVGGTTAPTGPLRGQTKGYWLDVRDLMLYGDQFVSIADAAGYRLALPSATGEKRWVTKAMIEGLFANAAKCNIRQEGVARLSILGHPTTSTDMT